MNQRTPWWVGTVLALAVVLAFAYFVWPTPWEYLANDLRRHQLTGGYEVLVDGRWTPAKTYPTRFAPGPPGRPLEETLKDLPPP